VTPLDIKQVVGLQDQANVSASDGTSRDAEIASLKEELAKKEEELDDLRFKLSQAHTLLLQKEQTMNSMTRSIGWRVLSYYGPIKYRFVKPPLEWVKALLTRRSRISLTRGNKYLEWVRMCEDFRYRPERAAADLKEFRYQPLISIVMPTFETPSEWLIKALESVCAQLYPHWELCVCDDASSQPDVVEILDQYSAKDSRIRVLRSKARRGIAETSNAALSLANGEFVGFLDHDDELTPDALLEVARALQETDSDLIYSDEDKIDFNGDRCDPFAKPAWSPDLFLSTNYLCHFSVYRRTILEKIGGLRQGVEGSQDYDLALRFTEYTDRVIHIPKILYHWRKVTGSAAAAVGAKPYAYESAARALGEAIRRRGIAGEIVPDKVPGYFRVKRRILKRTKVSIIIPTRDRLSLLGRCIDSIETKTDYGDYEIIIVDNGSKQPETLRYLSDTSHKVIRDDGPFNFSKLNNIAAAAATGEYLLMLNNDTEVISPEWISAMVEQAQRPEVGAVGGKLLYPGGTVQHAGVILGIGGVASHSHRGSVGQPGSCYFNFPNVIGDYSAVTAACLMIRKDLFTKIGGFNERSLAVSFNDVDLCLRLRRLGFLVVFTPYALLYHYESASRSKRVNMAENGYMLDKWPREISSDPYYNPSLSTADEHYSWDYSKPEAFRRFWVQDLSQSLTPRLKPGLTVGQYFTAPDDSLCGVSVMFGTYRRKCEGKVRLRIRESHRAFDELAFSELDASRIGDNRYCVFPIGPVRHIRGKRLFFEVEMIEGQSRNAPALWRTAKTNDVVGPHYENHKPFNGTLCFGAYSAIDYREQSPVGGAVELAHPASV
jgi:GT2 family glycosyltransferase